MKKQLTVILIAISFCSWAQVYTSEVEVKADANGNVGIGTSAPAQKLTVLTNSNDNGIFLANDSYTLGQIAMAANAGYLQLKDAGSVGLQLHANGNSYVNGGKLGVGTSFPSSTLHVNGVTTFGSSIPFRLWVGGSGSSHHVRFGTDYGHYGDAAMEIYQNYTGGSGSQPGKVVVNGTLGVGTAYPSYKLDVSGSARASAWYTTSDERSKKNIRGLSNAEKFTQLNAYAYEFEDDQDNRTHFGFLAQEIEEEFPELVVTDSAGYKAVAYQEFIPIMLEVLKEQEVRIQSLEKMVAKLKGKHER